MGNCTSAKKKSSWDSQWDSQPMDTAAVATSETNLRILDFELCLSNVKLKGISYPTGVSVGFYISGILDFRLGKQNPCDNETEPDCAKWDLDKHVNFQMSEWQLRKKFMNVYVLRDDVRVADIKFNLYLIATGPYHQDFPIRYTNKTFGRICADIRISQVVDTVISAHSATVTLIKERPAEAFNFTIKTICNAFKSHESPHSYNEELILQNTFHREMEAMNSKTPATISKHDLVRSTLDEMHKISWDKSKADQLYLAIPKLEMSLSVSDIHNTSLQFLMWQVVAPKTNKQKAEDQVETYVLFAECYMSFNKVLEREFTEKIIDGTMKDCFSMVVAEKIWNKGKLIGEVRLGLEVVIPKFFKQMTVYVRSEEGIQKITPFFNFSKENGEFCKEISDILNIQTKIEQVMADLSNTNRKSKMPEFKVRIEKRKIYDYLNQLLAVLELSKKQSMVIYGYSSEKDLYKGQLTLIEVGFKLAECIEEDDTSLHDICWKCLIALMKRAELTLRYLGFSTEEKKQSQERSPSNSTKRKIDLGLKVQAFFYQMLKIVLECLAKKALSQNQRMFVELFLAYSFFRIPEFRQRILQVIKRPDDEADEQWQLSERVNLTDDADTLDSLFNWDQNFYKPLSGNQIYNNNIENLKGLLDKKEWIQRMQKRSVAFFFFVMYWVKYVEQTLIQSENVKWNYLPNYNDIIRVFLSEMKRRPLIEYPDSLVETSIRLLANEKLLNKMIKILFEKTNLYNCVSVIKCVEMIDKYFTFLMSTGRSIPTTFNYTYFFSGIRNILESQHCFAVAKCLLMIYTNYDLLGFDCKRDFTFYLMGKAFFRLFLNWSSNVRTVFHHLLVFRIYLQADIVPSKPKTTGNQQFMQKQILFNQEVRRRYQALMFILERGMKLQTQRDNMKFANNYEKDYSKKMRKKLMEKRKLGVNSPERKLHNRVTQVNLEQINNVKFQAQKIVQRHHSQTIHFTTVNYPEQFLHPKNHASNFSPPKEGSTLQVPTATTLSIRKLSDMNIEIPKIRKIGPYEQYFELPVIEIQQFSYLTVATGQFKAIEEIFVKIYGKKKAAIEKVPVLKVKVPLDEAQTRPEQLDQW